MVSRDFLTAPQKIYGLRFAKDFGLSYFGKKTAYFLFKDRVLSPKIIRVKRACGSVRVKYTALISKIYDPGGKYPGLSEK